MCISTNMKMYVIYTMYRWWHFQAQFSFRDFMVVEDSDPVGSSFEEQYSFIHFHSYRHFGSHSSFWGSVITISRILNLLNLQLLFCRILWLHLELALKINSVWIWGDPLSKLIRLCLCFCTCQVCVCIILASNRRSRLFIFLASKLGESPVYKFICACISS